MCLIGAGAGNVALRSLGHQYQLNDRFALHVCIEKHLQCIYESVFTFNNVLTYLFRQRQVAAI